MKNIHYSWWICAACTLLIFCTMGLTTNAFTVFQPYLIADGGLSNTQASLVVAIRNLFALFSMGIIEEFYRQAGIRLGASIAVAGIALSLLMFGAAHSFLGYSLAAAFTGVFYGLGGMFPISIIIGRWFRSHLALALGISAAGTGFATIVMPPLITLMIERFSLSFAFYAEAAFTAAAMLVIYAMLRNRPEEKGLAPLFTGKMEPGPQLNLRQNGAGRSVNLAMALAVVLIGIFGNVGFSHLAVLYKSAGMDQLTIAYLITFVGLVLTAGKFIYGYATDRLGASRSGYIFFGLVLLGYALCALAEQTGHAVALAAMVCLGLGLPLPSVGLSVFAADTAAPSEYPRIVKRFQAAYMLGALSFGPIPGMIADASGSYVPFYWLLVGVTGLALLLVQGSYWRMGVMQAREGKMLEAVEVLAKTGAGH